jgi:mono/diheme cytochrome c family protein
MKNILACAAFVMLVAGCASTQEGTPASGAAPTAPVADAAPAADASSGSAFYTVAQATRGSGLFRDNCVSCHSSSEFAGSSFVRRWTNRAVGNIYEFILYSMPEDNPGGLPQQTYADIIAYFLQMNDFPAGDTELPTSLDALMEMKMWAAAGGQ